MTLSVFPKQTELDRLKRDIAAARDTVELIRERKIYPKTAVYTCSVVAMDCADVSDSVMRTQAKSVFMVALVVIPCAVTCLFSCFAVESEFGSSAFYALNVSAFLFAAATYGTAWLSNLEMDVSTELATMQTNDLLAHLEMIVDKSVIERLEQL